MDVRPVTEELVRRLEGAAVAFSVEWLEAVRSLPGNPIGIRLERFGSAWAPATPDRSDVDFLNRVGCLFPEDADRVPELVAYYRELGIRPWFEVLPGEGFERLAERLAAAGAAQIDFFTVLFGPPAVAPDAAAPAVHVREIGADELHVHTDVMLRGHEVPEAARDPRLHTGWAEIDGWRLYLAEVEGLPAAAAVLRIGDGIGLLANAATVPEFRGRGCQTALVRHRIADAAAAGCELISAQTAFGSSSQRNMERAGLVVACTKAVWRLQS